MTDLWQRLKQRKIVQWAVAYVAFAFALLQGVDIVAQQFGWPEGVRRGTTIALVIGFFVVLVLAWYHGERGSQRVGGTELLIIALLLAVGGGFLWRFARAPTAAQGNASVASVSVPAKAGSSSAASAGTAATAAAAAAPAKSVAVLPFTSMSAGKDDALFADGLSEEIINSLTRVPDLQVAARTSSFAFRGSHDTIPQIAARLHVATVLEGSVRRAGKRLRITAQLIRASDGFDLWSESYDRSSEDVIAIQEDVARQIALALKTATDPAALAAMQRAGTRSVAAYDAYLRGLAIEQKASQQADFTRAADALAAYSRATRLDPGFADAWARAAGLEWGMLRPSSLGSQEATASNYASRLQRWRNDIDHASEHARDAAERSYYDALSASSWQQFVRALELMRDYVRTYPNSASAYGYIGTWSLYVGDDAGARAAAEAMGKLAAKRGIGPESPVTLLVWAGDGKRAAHYAGVTLQADPGGIEETYQAQRAFLTAGNIQAAAKLVPRLMASRLDPQSKLLVQMRQACAEGRTAEAGKLYARMATIPGPGTGSRWNALQLLGRPRDASRLLARLDTPVYFNALSSYLVYPYFDVSRFPNLQKVLLAQGIHRPPPRREPYACKPQPAATH